MFNSVCFTILCFAVGLSFAHHPGGGGISSFFGGFRLPFVRPTPVSICTVNGTAQLYLQQTLTTCNNLQANATTNAILQLILPNFVAYIRNATNQALVTSNCPAFVTGVKAAKAADAVANRNRQLLIFNIEQQIEQIARTVTGTYGPIDVNSDH